MANFDDLLNNTPAEETEVPRLSKEEYKEKKQADREELFDLSARAAEEVSADGGYLRQYLDVQGRFSRYSAANSLLILSQQDKLSSHTATRLGDFDYWKSQNASVKEKSVISILERSVYTKDDGTPGVGYDVKKVFDISQVDTRRLKVKPSPHLGERQLLGALTSKAPVRIAGADELPGDLSARYDPGADTIFVRREMEFSDIFRAVAQELAFVDLTGRESTPAEPHFSAHCAAYLLCKKYGVDTQAFSFDGAPQVFEGMDAQEVKGELSHIRNAAEDISERMSRNIEAQQQKAAKSNDAR